MRHVPEDAKWYRLDGAIFPAKTVGHTDKPDLITEENRHGSPSGETVTKETILARARDRNIDVEYSAFTILAEHRLCRAYVLFRDFIADRDMTDALGRKDESDIVVSFFERSGRNARPARKFPQTFNRQNGGVT